VLGKNSSGRLEDFKTLSLEWNISPLTPPFLGIKKGALGGNSWGGGEKNSFLREDTRERQNLLTSS